MRAVLQRVAWAGVAVASDEGDEEVGRIGSGLLVLLGVAVGDTAARAQKLAARIAALRIFDDVEGRMNRDVREAGGAVLVVSQFTLLADASRGRRPSYAGAARPDEARLLYETVVDALKGQGLYVETGAFGAHMQVSLLNDGPVTLILDE